MQFFSEQMLFLCKYDLIMLLCEEPLILLQISICVRKNFGFGERKL